MHPIKQNILLKKFHGSGDIMRIGQEIQCLSYAGFFCLNTKLIVVDSMIQLKFLDKLIVVDSMIQLKFLDKEHNR